MYPRLQYKRFMPRDMDLKTPLLDATASKAGIYMFTNKINKKTYIGKSIDLFKRLHTYYWFSFSIPKNIHPHTPLLRAMKKFGRSNFKIAILENCRPSSLSKREQLYISTFKPQYNLRKTVHICPKKKDSSH